MNAVSDAELLPCPFCGSPADLEHGSDHHGEWFNLGCSRHWGNVEPDQACIGGRLWYTEAELPEDEAVSNWNRRALTAQKPVVKPLEWDDYVADTPFGAYTVGPGAEDKFHFTFHTYPYGSESDESWETDDEAKAAAQADYERRVLSAII